MGNQIDRRTLLKLAGVAGVTGSLAGCVGDDADDADDTVAADDTDDADDTVDADDTDDAADTEESALGGREIRYGVLMPETGDLGSLGPPIRDGALLVAEQLSGEVDAEINPSTGDTQTDPVAGISEANSLVDAGIPAIVGAAASNVTNQVIREATIPNQVVTISPASTDPGITHVDDDGYNFRTAPSDALQGPVLAEIAMSEFDAPETCSTMFLNDDYGQALEGTFVEAFESEHGGEVLERNSFEPEQPSYSSQLEAVMDPGPDFLWIVGFPDSGIQLFRDFYANFDNDFPVLVPDGLIDPGLPSEVGNDMNNVWGSSAAAVGPGVETFQELYLDQFGSEPGVFNGHAYDAAAIIVLANARAGENDGTAIRDNIREVSNPGGEVISAENLAEGVEMAAAGEEIQYQGASSETNFDDNGDMLSVAYDVIQYQDGELTTVRTIEFGDEE